MNELLIMVEDPRGPRCYSTLEQFLRAVTMGAVHRLGTTLAYRIYVRDTGLTAWPPPRLDCLRRELDHVLTWPLPGRHKTEADARRDFVGRALDHLSQV